MSQAEWDKYFFDIANVVKTKSKDERTKVGAVIVGTGHEIISTGYNSFPRGIDDTRPERQSRPEKYFWFAHAERNAIYNAARVGVSTLNSTLYITAEMPCTGCAIAIINSGIIRVCGIKGGKPNSNVEDLKRSAQMFKEAGVEICWNKF